MPIWSCEFDQQSPGRLAGLMVGSSRIDPAWTEVELGAVLRHQLATPIETELIALGAAAATRFKTLCGADAEAATTMSSVFGRSDPALPALEMIKEYAKSLLEHPDSPLPKEVAGVLYWTSIAAALVLKKTRITRLDDSNLRDGLCWAASRTWLEPRTRELLQAAISQVQSNTSP